MSQPETRTLPSGLTVNIIRQTIDIAPLSNKQTEAYLTNQPAADAAPEVWMDRSWELLATAANNANAITGNPATTVDDLKAKIGTNDMTQLYKAIFEISGLVLKGNDTATAGEAKAALSIGDGTSVN